MGCEDELTTTPLSDNELQVDISTTIDSFFMGVMGFDDFDIARSATAQYVKPVPMGSPDQCFGRDPSGDGYRCPDTGNDSFWAAVSAPYTLREQGDPYSTTCFEPATYQSCLSSNNEYARSGSYGGYYYAVEVGSGVSDLTVQIYDAGFFPEYTGSNDTGDGKWGVGAGNPWADTLYSFHYVDSTPSDPTDNPAVSGCSFRIYPQWGAGAMRDKWATGANSLCHISGPVTPGVWVVHVETDGDGSGSNHYSVRAFSGSGPDPRVYGINDISIWNNRSGSAELYLVEVDPIHAGSKLELQFFDPGDADDDSDMEVWAPDGSGGFTVPNCDWEATDYSGTAVDAQVGPCHWETTDTTSPPWYATGNHVFNNLWITAIIDIPSDYTCNSGADGCFWKMKLNLSDPAERTTWRARVIGNPVRLVP